MGLASSKAANSIAASSSNGGGSKCVDNVIIGTHNHHPDIQQPCSLLPSPSSGFSIGGGIDTWKPAASSCHVRQASIRSRNLQPMPDIGELDRRFAKVLVSSFEYSCLRCEYVCVCLWFLFGRARQYLNQRYITSRARSKCAWGRLELLHGVNSTLKIKVIDCITS